MLDLKHACRIGSNKPNKSKERNIHSHWAGRDWCDPPAPLPMHMNTSWTQKHLKCVQMKNETWNMKIYLINQYLCWKHSKDTTSEEECFYITWGRERSKFIVILFYYVCFPSKQMTRFWGIISVDGFKPSTKQRFSLLITVLTAEVPSSERISALVLGQENEGQELI